MLNIKRMRAAITVWLTGKLVEQLMIDMFALQAGIAFRACVLVLEDALRPKNCFQILRVAASTGNQRLYARSAAMALLHFQQAILQDPTGLQVLPREVLGSLLSHDYLQVNTHSAASNHVALFQEKTIAAGPKDCYNDGIVRVSRFDAICVMNLSSRSEARMICLSAL